MVGCKFFTLVEKVFHSTIVKCVENGGKVWPGGGGGILELSNFERSFRKSYFRPGAGHRHEREKR